jgi:hypothetical protein
VLLATPGNQALAVFDFYCYVSAMKGTRFLVWFEQNSAIGASMTPSTAIRLELLDADRLEVIEDVETASRELTMRRDRSRVWHRGGEVSACSVPAYLPAGTHRFPLPSEFREIDELLILAHCTTTAEMNLALHIVRPRENTIEVIPQDWFNKGNYDFGYQWPTRVAREPVTRKIFGEGFRLGRFVLDETGHRIEQWFQTDLAWHPERHMYDDRSAG